MVIHKEKQMNNEENIDSNLFENGIIVIECLMISVVYENRILKYYAFRFISRR